MTESFRGALPGRLLADRFGLETPFLTFAFWTTVALMMTAFWVTPFPPLIDYPQHVAVGAILHRMADPASPERQLYDVNLITYNGGFHLLVALLSFLCKPETAGKILLSLYPPMLAVAALALIESSGRPRWYALLVLPITFSFVVGWGFANYFLCVPLAMLAFTWWLRGFRGEPGMGLRVAVASLVLAYSHVLATLCLCVAIGVAALSMWSRLGETAGRRVIAVLKLPLAVLPAILWCTAVFIHNRHSPHANWEGWDDGLDDPLWYKLIHLTAYAVGNFTDRSDQVLLALAVAIMILLWQSPRRTEASDPMMRTLAITWSAIYCVIPKVFIATWFIFERFPTWMMAFAVPAIPIVPFSASRTLRGLAAAVAVASGVNTVWHLAHIPGEADATAILDDIPVGKRVVAVTWSNHGENVVLREMWVHLLAYYLARHPGQIGYSFAKFESMPVHYRLDRVPPEVTPGLEWDARKYDPRSPSGRYFTTVLVRSPDDRPEDDPRFLTFRETAPLVKLLSRRGRFWLYDASALQALPSPATKGHDDESASGG